MIFARRELRKAFTSSRLSTRPRLGRIVGPKGGLSVHPPAASSPRPQTAVVWRTAPVWCFSSTKGRGHDGEEGSAGHRRRAGHGRGHREGGPGRRVRGRRDG